MKKLIFLVIVLALTARLYGQEPGQHVFCGWYISLPSIDTARTFNFSNMNLDSCRIKLIDYWGTPDQNTEGIMFWKNIKIKNIGKELNIHLTDRLCTIDDYSISCVTFEDEKDKAEKLKNIQPGQVRDIEITITDKENKDIIMDKSKAEMMRQLLESIVK